MLQTEYLGKPQVFKCSGIYMKNIQLGMKFDIYGKIFNTYLTRHIHILLEVVFGSNGVRHRGH